MRVGHYLLNERTKKIHKATQESDTGLLGVQCRTSKLQQSTLREINTNEVDLYKRCRMCWPRKRS